MEWFEKWVNNRTLHVGKGARRREDAAPKPTTTAVSRRANPGDYEARDPEADLLCMPADSDGARLQVP